MKVLHITNWFPNQDNPKEAPWIKNHIDSLPESIANHIIHFEIKPGNRFKRSTHRTPELQQTIIHIPFKTWFIIEMLYGLWLIYKLVILRTHHKYDIINVHIAYPLLTYWHWIKKLVKTPLVISEHWSAYHFNFNAKKELPRIQKIFQQNIPVITVSESLHSDLRNFSSSVFPGYVVPNIVNEELFHPDPSIERGNHFFMVSKWKWPKLPLIVFDAFKEFHIQHPDFTLVVGGYGPDYGAMEEWIQENHMKGKIQLIGSLNSEEIAHHLKTCKAFLHCSEYETFSVVCAEAVCCHTPVIASKIGGIPEVVDTNEGILLDSFNVVNWSNTMEECISKTFAFKKKDQFSKKVVGNKYADILYNCTNAIK